MDIDTYLLGCCGALLLVIFKLRLEYIEIKSHKSLNFEKINLYYDLSGNYIYSLKPTIVDIIIRLIFYSLFMTILSWLGFFLVLESFISWSLKIRYRTDREKIINNRLCDSRLSHYEVEKIREELDMINGDRVLYVNPEASVNEDIPITIDFDKKLIKQKDLQDTGDCYYYTHEYRIENIKCFYRTVDYSEVLYNSCKLSEYISCGVVLVSNLLRDANHSEILTLSVPERVEKLKLKVKWKEVEADYKYKILTGEIQSGNKELEKLITEEIERLNIILYEIERFASKNDYLLDVVATEESDHLEECNDDRYVFINPKDIDTKLLISTELGPDLIKTLNSSTYEIDNLYMMICRLSDCLP